MGRTINWEEFNKRQAKEEATQIVSDMCARLRLEGANGLQACMPVHHDVQKRLRSIKNLNFKDYQAISQMARRMFFWFVMKKPKVFGQTFERDATPNLGSTVEVADFKKRMRIKKLA
jgi:hypothetical protein